jgi:hypothetical protein
MLDHFGMHAYSVPSDQIKGSKISEVEEEEDLAEEEEDCDATRWTG